MTEDTELVQLVLNGDEGALRRLISENQGRVRAYIGKFIRSASVVDDLAQDVFVAAYKSLATYKAERPLSAWLLGIARNHALMHLRKASRYSKHVVGSVDDILFKVRLDECENETERGFDVEAQMVALRNCMGKLPEKNLCVMKEHYYEEKDTETIAAALNMKGTAVRVMLLRIRNALRKCIESSMQTGVVSREAC